MNEAKLTRLEQIKAFLKGTEAVELSVCGRVAIATTISGRCCDDSAMATETVIPEEVQEALRGIA